MKIDAQLLALAIGVVIPMLTALLTKRYAKLAWEHVVVLALSVLGGVLVQVQQSDGLLTKKTLLAGMFAFVAAQSTNGHLSATFSLTDWLGKATAEFGLGKDLASNKLAKLAPSIFAGPTGTSIATIAAMSPPNPIKMGARSLDDLLPGVSGDSPVAYDPETPRPAILSGSNGGSPGGSSLPYAYTTITIPAVPAAPEAPAASNVASDGGLTDALQLLRSASAQGGMVPGVPNETSAPAPSDI